jgi:hypothetical protein
MAYDPMVHLYYRSKRLCRQDCDALGIDRRRVITLRSRQATWSWITDDGQELPRWNGNGTPNDPIEVTLIAKIKVRQSLIDTAGVDNLHHDDDETWS